MCREGCPSLGAAQRGTASSAAPGRSAFVTLRQRCMYRTRTMNGYMFNESPACVAQVPRALLTVSNASSASVCLVNKTRMTGQAPIH
eukprot:8143038-Pyramimonas_sp.AAC.1